LNNSRKSGLFTSRGCHSGKEAAHEAVVNYAEGAATKPMRQDRLARRVKNGDNKIFYCLNKERVSGFYE
jgi:hypothetical protein